MATGHFCETNAEKASPIFLAHFIAPTWLKLMLMAADFVAARNGKSQTASSCSVAIYEEQVQELQEPLFLSCVKNFTWSEKQRAGET